MRVEEPRIKAIETQLGVDLPEDLRLVYSVADGRFNPGGQWWVVWQLERLVSDNRDAWRRGLPKTLVAFGDDGAGNPFCVSTETPSVQVFRWNWIDLAVEASEGSMEDFIAEWVEDTA